jgi:preprotein translocase subunit SecA
MRIFGSDRIAKVMERLGMEEGQDIQHPLITRAIETAQKRVEGHNFEIRKWLLKYDDVMNKQREVIYGYRNLLLEEMSIREYIFDAVYETLDLVLNKYYETENTESGVNFPALARDVFSVFRILAKPEELEGKNKEELHETLLNILKSEYSKKEKMLEDAMFNNYLRWRLLDVVDRKWKDHLYAMDEMRESVGLRAWGQIDPLIEFQREGHKMFAEMMGSIKSDSVTEFYSMPAVSIKKEDLVRETKFEISEMVHPEFKEGYAPAHKEADNPEGSQAAEQEHKGVTYKRQDDKVGRNDSCPCGSGKKYKKCCGR